jgi:two-component system response regulator RegA
VKREEGKLLIVDDDDTFREVLARALTRVGFTVVTAANPQAGFDACREHSPEYIVLDLNLAGQSGLNLIPKLIEFVPHVRIVVLTGYASIQTAVGALKLGALQYLPKPANLADILNALHDDVELQESYDSDLDRMSVDHLEWEYIQRALAEHDGNIAATARALKMHRRTLQRKLAKKRPADRTSTPPMTPPRGDADKGAV